MEMGKKLYLAGSHCPAFGPWSSWYDHYSFQNTNTPVSRNPAECAPPYASTTSVGLAPGVGYYFSDVPTIL